MNSASVFDRQRAVDDEHVGRAADHADRREVLDRVVRHVARRRRRAVGRDVALHQRVAVGYGARGGDAGDDAAAAALVLDDEVLAERLAPALGDDARDHVVAAAGGDRDDVADRLARKRLRARCRGKQSRAGACRIVRRFIRCLLAGPAARRADVLVSAAFSRRVSVAPAAASAPISRSVPSAPCRDDDDFRGRRAFARSARGCSRRE